MTCPSEIEDIAPGSVRVDTREPNRVFVLDSIRGVASFIVVIHHCLLTQPAFSDYFFSNWQTKAESTAQNLLFNTPLRLVWDGTEAVTLFYVLSGLVLSMPWIEGRPPNYFDYFIKRVCRLYLPYCAAVSLAAVLAVWLHPYATVPGLSDWVNNMNWTKEVTPRILLDHAVMLGHKNMLNGVIHTLIWEVRVSLLFPFLIVPIIRWRLTGAVGVTLVLLAVVFSIQFIYGEDRPLLNLMEWRFGLSRLGQVAIEVQWTAYYCILFVFGSSIALCLERLRRFPVNFTFLTLGSGLLIFQGHWSQQHVIQDFMVAAGAVMIIISALPAGPIYGALSHRWLRWMGRISFSLYLVHVPLLLAATILLHAYVPQALILVVIPFASIGLASLFNEWVVEPSARLGKSLARKRSDITRVTPGKPGNVIDGSGFHASSSTYSA